MKDLSKEILSDITIYMKYAKYLPNKHRRETWDEICNRYATMMFNKYPNLADEIEDNMKYIREKKVLPSMRALQFAGAAIGKNNSRLYNCCYLPMDDYRAFGEVMFLLLGGTGVGYSVQKHHVEKLPEIRKPLRSRKFLVGDSIEGWADAIKALMKSYFGLQSKPRFDFSDIRPKGAELITAGGKAPGAEPLKRCLQQIELILERFNNGDKLKPIDVHDINCHIANSVLSGGIRRSAMIAGFSLDDEDMLTCKYGNWWETNEQRGRSNNSAVILRHKIKEEEFKQLWKKIELSNSGEPGVYFTNDKEWFTNPCVEIALRPFQFCNLTTINVSDIKDQEDFNMRCVVASFFGTLQAGFTDFHYLRDIWKRTTEKDALIGVSMTGLASNPELDYKIGAEIVKEENGRVAYLIGINSAARTTCVKPEGTTSLVLGCSSGIHAYHDEYYIRRIRVGKNEAIYTYLLIYHPELLEDDLMKSNQAIIKIPQKSTEKAAIRTENVFNLLQRIKYISETWIKSGHIKGENTHNVSATIPISKKYYTFAEGIRYVSGITEWEAVGIWMWNNRNIYNGLSVLPYDGGTYVQAPFESCSKEVYEEMMKSLCNIDLTKVVELIDNTSLSESVACGGGNCEII